MRTMWNIETEEPEPMIETLSRRELEIAILIARGLTYQEIADQLSISYHTVNAHMKTILSKTGLSSSRKLAVVVTDAIRRGEITDTRDGNENGSA